MNKVRVNNGIVADEIDKERLPVAMKYKAYEDNMQSKDKFLFLIWIYIEHGDHGCENELL